MRHFLFDCAVFIATLIFIMYLAGYHIVWPPTPDQLYGCTWAQQLPNGDCP